MVKRTHAASLAEETVADMEAPKKKTRRSPLVDMEVADAEASSKYCDKQKKKQQLGIEPGAAQIASSEPIELAKPPSKKKKKQADVSLELPDVAEEAENTEVADSRMKSTEEMTPAKAVVLKYGWDWLERMKAEFKKLSVRTSADVIEVLGSNKVRKTFSLAFNGGGPQFVGEHPTKKSFPLTIQCRDTKDTCQEPVRLSNGDVMLRCIDCGNDYVFPKDEQIVFSNLGFESQPPKRCVDCRRAKKERNLRIAAKDAKGESKIGKAGKEQSRGKGCGKDGKGKAKTGKDKAKHEGKGKHRDEKGKRKDGAVNGRGGICFNSRRGAALLGIAVIFAFGMN